MAFPQWRRWRHRAGIPSQAELARRVGIDPAMISRLENDKLEPGRGRISLRLLWRLAIVLGLSSAETLMALAWCVGEEVPACWRQPRREAA